MDLEFFKCLTKNEINTLKLIVRKGLWGDCDMGFVSFDWITKGCQGEREYTTLGAIGCNTKGIGGKEVSGTISSIVKKIKTDNDLAHVLCYIEDWWEDGKGDMIFFNEESLGITWGDLQVWAEEEVDYEEVDYTEYFDSLQTAIALQSKGEINYAISDICTNVRTMTKEQGILLKSGIAQLIRISLQYERESLIEVVRGRIMNG